MDMIETLRAEQAALHGRLREIEQLIEDYKKWQERVANVVGQHVPTLSGTSADHSDENVTASRPQTPIADFEKAVIDVLSRSESPRNRTDLLADLESVGIVVGGSDARNTLSARLTRMPKITNIKGHGYWLRGRPYGPANYPPDERVAGPAPVNGLGAVPDEPSGTREGVEKGSDAPAEDFEKFLNSRDDEDLL